MRFDGRETRKRTHVQLIWVGTFPSSQNQRTHSIILFLAFPARCAFARIAVGIISQWLQFDIVIVDSWLGKPNIADDDDDKKAKDERRAHSRQRFLFRRFFGRKVGDSVVIYGGRTINNDYYTLRLVMIRDTIPVEKPNRKVFRNKIMLIAFDARYEFVIHRSNHSLIVLGEIDRKNSRLIRSLFWDVHIGSAAFWFWITIISNDDRAR